MRIIYYIALLALVFTNLVNASDLCCCALKNPDTSVSHQEKQNVSKESSRKHHCSLSQRRCCKKSKTSKMKCHSEKSEDTSQNNLQDDNCNCQKDLQTQTGIFLATDKLENNLITTKINLYQEVTPSSTPNTIYYPPKFSH